MLRNTPESRLFSKLHQRLLLVLGIIFVAALTLRLNGYSLPIWHQYIDGSKPTEIRYGKSRSVRADDYALDIPEMLAQWAHHPQFPLINGNIGFGQNMLAPIKVPVNRPLILFRPIVWGFYFSPDIGLSWMWWVGVLGLFYLGFLLFYVLSDHRFWLSVLASLTVVYSPFFQFWSFHKVEVAIHALSIFLAWTALWFSRKRWQIILCGLFLGWSAGCFIFDHMYPPFQITMAYLMLFLAIGFFWERRHIVPWREFLGVRLIATLSALGILAFSVYTFLHDGRELMSLINHTVYPGSRFSLGGGIPFWVATSPHFFAHAIMKQWQPLGNPCEAAGFLYFFPLLFGVWAVERIHQQKKLSPIVGLFFFYCFALFVFALIGFSPFVAKFSLFYKVTDNRLAMALGFANVILIVLFLARPSKGAITNRARVMMLTVWAMFLFCEGLLLKNHIPEMPWWFFLLGWAVNIGLGFLLLTPNRALEFLGAWFLISIAFTFGFNPIVRGGTQYLYENPLAQEIIHLDKQSGHKTTWVSFSDSDDAATTSYLRMLGVRALDGYYGHPQFALWRILDPNGSAYSVYNQCAYVTFIARPIATREIASRFPGTIQVYTSPGDPVFRQLNVDYFLVFGKATEAFETSPKVERVYAYGRAHIYRVRR